MAYSTFRVNIKQFLSLKSRFGTGRPTLLLLLLLLSLSPLYTIFTRMSLRQTMFLGDTLLQLLFRFIVNTLYGAYLPRSYVGSDMSALSGEYVCSA